MHEDDSDILSLVIKSLGITNLSLQIFALRIRSFKNVPTCLRNLKVFERNLNACIIFTYSVR